MKVHKICKTCTKQFSKVVLDSGYNILYCSDECKNLNKKRQCRYCKNEFVAKFNTTKFCSNECKFNYKKKPVEVSCDHCGNILIRKPHEITTRDKFFCDKVCSDLNKKLKKKICPYCKVEKLRADYVLRIINHREVISYGCRDCENSKLRNWRSQFKEKTGMGYEAVRSMRNPAEYLLKRAKSNARHKWDFNLDIEYIDKQLKIQDFKCALTGNPLTFVAGKGKVLTNASVDRKDSSKGYVRGNIQILMYGINIMKGQLSVDEFVSMCKMVIEYVDKRPKNQ